MQKMDQLIKQANFIGGKWIEKGSGEFIYVRNKYDQTLLANIPLASKAQVEDAIKASVSGFRLFKTFSAGKRHEMLKRLAALISEKADAFSNLIAARSRKTDIIRQRRSLQMHSNPGIFSC